MTLGFVFVFFLLLCSYAESSNNTTEHNRVVGGVPADIRNFPYQLALETQMGRFVCGASIIHQWWAVTAAHCINTSMIHQWWAISTPYYIYRYPRSYRLRSESSFQLTGGTLHQAQTIIVHPSYNRLRMDYDVAVIKVNKPFSYGGILMASRTPSQGTPAVVSGWGVFKPGGLTPFQLQQATVYIMDYQTCTQIYRLTPRMMCAGFSYGGRGPCCGDSGGPLVAKGKLVGIVSWGTICGSAHLPEVFTNVAQVNNWVESTIRRYT